MKTLFGLVWFLVQVSLMILAGILFGGIAHFLIESRWIILIPGLILIYFLGPYILELIIKYNLIKEIKKSSISKVVKSKKGGGFM